MARHRVQTGTFFLLVFSSLFVYDAHGFVDADKYVCRCEKFAYKNKPFVAIWNSPTNGCDFNFSTPINLKQFGIEENDHQTWDGRHVTVFSSAQLGLYPYFILNGQQNYNGGLPQTVDLGQHLRKARKDIEAKIPDANYDGLAVIDWEQWRPLWDTNWDLKKVYKVKSVELVRSRHPDWTLGKILEESKKEFEEAARALFEHTITIGKELRPKALWGFYGFPDCYGTEKDDYQCIEKTKKQNDQLEWLFSASSALFPSMYLLGRKPSNHNFVLGRLRETLRFATKGFGNSRRNIPIFVYHRNIYEQDERAYNFLQKDDLDRTIAVSANLGTAGVVIWGNRFDENTSPEVCRKIENYVQTTLGPYLQTKFKEVQHCAASKCHSEGHCVDKALLTPELLIRYETAHGSKRNCSTDVGPSNSKVLTAVRSKIPSHPRTSNGNDVSNIMQTLRDRNRDINEAFQASQNGLSQKMGEFFDAMYHNASIANSTGGFDKKSAVQKSSSGKPNSNHLNNIKDKEESKKPTGNAKDGVLHQDKHDKPDHAASKQHVPTELNAKKSETSAAASTRVPIVDSTKQSKKAESNHGNISSSNLGAQKNKAPPMHPAKLHADHMNSKEAVNYSKDALNSTLKLSVKGIAASSVQSLHQGSKEHKPEVHQKMPLTKEHLPLNGKNVSHDHVHVNKSNPVAPAHTKSESVKGNHKNTTESAGAKKLEKSLVHSANKNEVVAVPNVKKSDIPKQPKIEQVNQNHAEMAMGIGTENEQRASLEVLGQATNIEKSKSDGKSTSFVSKDHKYNITADVKASRKSEITGRNLESNWLSMPSKPRQKSWIPHIYVVLIGISIAGALMFSLMFVAAYYYVSLRHHPMIRREIVHPDNDTTKNTYLSPKGHSSPISSPNLSKSGKTKLGKNVVDVASSNGDQEVRPPHGDDIKPVQNEDNVNVDDKNAVNAVHCLPITKTLSLVPPEEDLDLTDSLENKEHSLDVEKISTTSTPKKEKQPLESKLQPPSSSSYKKGSNSTKRMQRSFSAETNPRSHSSKISQVEPVENSQTNKEPTIISSSKRSRSSSRDKKDPSDLESQGKHETLQKTSEVKSGSKTPEKNKKSHVRTKIPNLDNASGKRVGGRASLLSGDHKGGKVRREPKASTSLPSMDNGDEDNNPGSGVKKGGSSSRRWKQNTTLPELSKARNKKQNNSSKDNSLDVSEVEIDINKLGLSS